MSGNEPTTGWEAQAWDAPTQEEERSQRLARLAPPVDDLAGDDAARAAEPADQGGGEATPVADEQLDDHAGADDVPATAVDEPHQVDAADPVEPVVPDDVETTVPIGAAGTTDTVGTAVAEPDSEHEVPAMTAEAPVEPPAAHEPAPSGDGTTSADAWRDLQVQFVDDPSGAVSGAVALVQRAVEAHAGADGSTDTEHLRQVFTRLRDLHARLSG